MKPAVKTCCTEYQAAVISRSSADVAEGSTELKQAGRLHKGDLQGTDEKGHSSKYSENKIRCTANIPKSGKSKNPKYFWSS